MKLEEVLKMYNKPTYYERRHGIKIVENWQIHFETPGLNFYTRLTDDARTALLMIFRAGKTDNWVSWMVNEVQAVTLTKHFPGIFAVIEEMNSQAKDRMKKNRS